MNTSTTKTVPCRSTNNNKKKRKTTNSLLSIRQIHITSLFSIWMIITLLLFYSITTSDDYFPSSNNNTTNIILTKTSSSLRSSSNDNTHPKKTTTDDDDSTSACLLVSDDNHFLIEWIAYHYHVVKLRHLIITMDPKSTTSPIKILERWSNKNYMTIELWDESRYFDSSTHHNLTGVEVHRQRQKEFNVECLRSLKTQKKSWVLVTDSDEFVTINPLLLQEQERPLDPKYRIEQPNSVHTFLQRILIPTPELNIYTPCIPIHRRQYSAKEETTTTTPVVDDDAVFNPIHFLTLRWNYWGSNKIDFPIATGKTCPLQYKAGPTKVIIDLSRLRLQDLYHPAIEGNPHKPIESLCSQYDMYNVADQTGLIIHHYVGTQEQWDYRRNDHRGVGYRMARYQAIHDHVGIHTNQNDYDTIQSWLKGFIQNVGTNEAILLLDEVGKIDPPGTTTTTTTVVATTKQTTTYQVGDLVQAVFDINTAAIELEWYWVQITKTNVLQNATYYNVVFQYDCFEKLGVPAEEIRKNGTTVDTDLLRVNLTEYNPKNQN